MLEVVSLCSVVGLMIALSALGPMAGYELFSAVGSYDFRKDVISIIKLLFEKGYSADQVFNVIRFYCSS